MQDSLPPFDPDDAALVSRRGLPDALRALVREFPRDAWTENANYSGLIAFWLDKHISFRRLTEVLEGDTATMLDAQADPETFKRRLHRFGGMLIGDLHGHHQIEDAHYFPVMSGLDPVARHGFEILDRDHQQMDAYLSDLAETANAVLRAPDDAMTDAAAGFKASLDRFAPMLDRHLVDEEELVVPVLLKYAPPQFR